MGQKSFGSELLRWSRINKGAIIGSFVVWLIIGIGFICFAGSFIVKDFLLSTDGVETTGRVIGEETSEEMGEYGSNTIYHVNYKFSVGKATYEGDTQVSSSAYDKLSVGQKVDIIYYPPNPHLSRLKTGKAPVAIYLPYGFVALGLFIGWYPLVYIFRQVMHYAHLSSRGEETLGIISNITKKGNLCKIDYKFQDSIEQTHSGFTHVYARTGAKLKIGDVAGIVYYTPENPKQNCIDLTRKKK